MTKDIPEEQLRKAADFIAGNMGLRFPKESRRDLKRGINAAARELGFEDGGSYIAWLLTSKPSKCQIEILAGHLTVSETYFFRDKALFKALEERILPEFIELRRKSGKHLRIWSAGCSSGEEPYSIAILLNKMLPDLGDWHITILATDINMRFLQKAAGGVYREWSFRNVEPGIKETFFSRNSDGLFSLRRRFEEMVTFSYLNLVENTYPSLANNTNAMDFIFCRNVLMYFVRESARKVIGNFNRALIEGGYLIVGPSESSIPSGSQFEAVSATGTILFQKTASPKADAFCRRILEPPKIPFESASDVIDAAAPDLPKPADVIPEQHDRRKERRSQEKSETGGRDELYMEASALYEGGCYPEAVKKVEKLISQDPSDANCLALLARIYANWGRLAEALEWCRKAVRKEKLHAGHHFLMATILQESGRIEDAVVSLKKTLYLDPAFIPAHVSLGNIVRKSGRRKESEKHFRNALSLLASKRPDEVLPESGGINAQRMMEIIQAMQQQGETREVAE